MKQNTKIVRILLLYYCTILLRLFVVIVIKDFMSYMGIEPGLSRRDKNWDIDIKI